MCSHDRKRVLWRHGFEVWLEVEPGRLHQASQRGVRRFTTPGFVGADDALRDASPLREGMLRQARALARVAQHVSRFSHDCNYSESSLLRESCSARWAKRSAVSRRGRE